MPQSAPRVSQISRVRPEMSSPVDEHRERMGEVDRLQSLHSSGQMIGEHDVVVAEVADVRRRRQREHLVTDELAPARRLRVLDETYARVAQQRAHGLAYLVRGTVSYDHELKGANRLIEDALAGQVDRAGVTVGGNDYGDQRTVRSRRSSHQRNGTTSPACGES
ncbi:MAG: hypothetical protein QOF83_4012 [Solirubrobacteraceae bacterium]|nr:hypothetical protein [Solirubrobacteraceae bacterium]